MPNRDRTGPNSEGPRTGRGLGQCKEKGTETETRKGLGPCGDGTPRALRRQGRNSGRRFQNKA